MGPRSYQSGRRHVYHWNTDSTTTANDCLCADPALDDNNKIEEDVNAVYLQVAMRAIWATCRRNLLVGVRYEQTDVSSTSNILVPNNPGEWSGRTNNDFTGSAFRDGAGSPKRRTTTTSCRASTSTSC